MDMEVEFDGLFRHNDTYDYDEDYAYEEDIETKGSRAVLIPLLYSVVLVVGLLGNGLLLTVLAQKRRSWSLSDTFILHLSVSDVLLLVTLPFWAVQAGQYCGWCFGGFLCKISAVIFKINFYCGILLLFCISLDCYLSMAGATRLYSYKRPRLAHISCLLVWLTSLILTIPDWVYVGATKRMAQEKRWCVYNNPQSKSHWQLVSRMFHHTLGFLLPAAALIFCCVLILLRLQQSSKDLQKKKKEKAVMVILPLVAVFFLCWMPYNFTLIVETSRGSNSKENGDASSLRTALMVTSVLGCSHACLRPLLYLGLCGNFKKRALAMLRCAPAECESSLWELGVGKETLPEQSPEEDEELNQKKSDNQLAQSTQC